LLRSRENTTSKFDKTFPGVAAAALVCALALAAVSIPVAYGAEPEHNIVSIDAVKGLVTVKDSTTARLMQVKVTDTALLKSVRVGQLVMVDLECRSMASRSLMI